MIQNSKRTFLLCSTVSFDLSLNLRFVSQEVETPANTIPSKSGNKTLQGEKLRNGTVAAQVVEQEHRVRKIRVRTRLALLS